MLIVITHVSQSLNDKQELEPALENLSRIPENLGSVTDLLAVTGYYSASNVQLCEKRKITPYIAVERQHHPPLMERFAEPPPLPDNADAVAAMKHRLRTKSGKETYAKRKSTIETVFGIIKAVMGYRKFLRRGLDGSRPGAVTTPRTITASCTGANGWQRLGQRLRKAGAGTLSALNVRGGAQFRIVI
jgi:hypothetical protein